MNAAGIIHFSMHTSGTVFFRLWYIHGKSFIFFYFPERAKKTKMLLLNRTRKWNEKKIVLFVVVNPFRGYMEICGADKKTRAI